MCVLFGTYESSDFGKHLVIVEASITNAMVSLNSLKNISLDLKIRRNSKVR